MGYPGPPYPPPYPPPPPPPRNPTDVVVSIILMVAVVVVGACASVMGIFSLAFLDHCPPATCSAEGAVTAVMGALAAAALAGVTGIVLTIVALARRKPGWPFAAGTLAVVFGVLFAGMVGYSVAVGG